MTIARRSSSAKDSPTAAGPRRARRLAVLAAMSVACAAAIGTALWLAAARRQRPLNVLLITIDTLRADHVGSYGYKAAQTPALDALAARGLRFDRALTVAPLTLPAHASLMTGTFPVHHGVRDNAGFVLPDDQPTLAHVLRARGYRTGGFVAAFVLDHRWGIGRGFDRYSDRFDLGRYAPDVGVDTVQRSGREVVDEALAWLHEDRSRLFLAWVHLYEPHAPYAAPPEIRARFPGTPIGAYDAEVAAADVQVGRLVDALSAEGRLDRTIVAVVGDHGEALGDHREQEHGFFVYDATIRIPLIVAGPGIPSRAIRQQVRIVDVMPTILDLLDIDAPSAVQGRSLVPLAQGQQLDLVGLSETWYPRQHFGWSELTAIHDGRYKLIAAPRRELYDTEVDPGEVNDLASANPSRAASLEHALHDLLQKSSSRRSPAARPVDRDAEERLRALGYVGQTVPDPAGGRPRADPKDKILVYNLLKQAGDASAGGRIDEAIAAARQVVESDPAVAEGHIMLGGLLRKARKNDEAAAAFQRALALDPRSTKSSWQLADIWFELQEFAKAEGVLAPAISIAVDRPPFLTRLAECQIELQRYAEAERNLREALKENPEQPAAHYDLALVHEARSESSLAIAEYEAELRHHPATDRAHFNLARLLSAVGRSADALQHFEAAVQANPAFGSGFLYLAKARLDRGDLAGAEAAARQGLARDPDKRAAPLGHYVLADVYNRLGRPADAAREATAGRQLEQRVGRD